MCLAMELSIVQSLLNLTAKPGRKFAKGVRDRVNLGKDGKSGRDCLHCGAVSAFVF